MKRSALKRKTRMSRGKAFLSRRPSRSRIVVEREAQELWKASVGECQVCPAEGGRCSGEVQGHHAIFKRTLKRLGLHAFLWDLRIKVDVCTHRHEQITTDYKPLPRELLPASVFEFGDEVGLGWWLDRHYPATTVLAA